MNDTTPQPAGPWDALLKSGTPLEDTKENESYGTTTKVVGLLAALSSCESATTLDLAVRCSLTIRQVWGLLKQPRNNGQVRYVGGRWELVPGFPGVDVERAAELLRRHGWAVEPPASSRTRAAWFERAWVCSSCGHETEQLAENGSSDEAAYCPMCGSSAVDLVPSPRNA